MDSRSWKTQEPFAKSYVRYANLAKLQKQMNDVLVQLKRHRIGLHDAENKLDDYALNLASYYNRCYELKRQVRTNTNIIKNFVHTVNKRNARINELEDKLDAKNSK